MASLLRIAVATLRLGFGLLAIVLAGAALPHLLPDQLRQDEVDDLRWAVIGGCILLCVGLLILWSAALDSRRWMITLAVIAGVFAVLMVSRAILVGRIALTDAHRGLWADTWTPAAEGVLWALIALACIVDPRLRDHHNRAVRPWQAFAGVVGPLALIIALVVLYVRAVPIWQFGLNSRVTESVVAPGPAPKSTLSGSVRWARVLETETPAVSTGAGLAVPIAGDSTHSAGVVMLDPATGDTRWRYELRGIATGPELRSVDHGRTVIVELTFGRPEIPDGIVALSADTGRPRTAWHEDGNVHPTDPVVLYNEDDHGEGDAVIALSPDGGRLWTYHPNACTDFEAHGAAAVIIVSSGGCGGGLTGLDARTGAKLWDDATAGSVTQTVSGPDFTVEQTKSTLRRRDPSTGAISWTAKTGSDCHGLTPAISRSVGYAALTCNRGDTRSTVLATYDLRTGEQLSRRRVEHPITSLVAVDDHRVLALTSAEDDVCRAELLTSSSSRTAWSDPVDPEPASDHARDVIDCTESSVLPMTGGHLLQLRLVRRDDHTGDREVRYRFVALD